MYQEHVLAIKTRGPPLLFVALIGYYLLQVIYVKQMLVVYRSRIAVYMTAVCFGSSEVRGAWGSQPGWLEGPKMLAAKSSFFLSFFLSFLQTWGCVRT